MPGRFSLAYVSDVLSDVVNEAGVKVGCVVQAHGQDVLLLDVDGIGPLSGADLYALAAVIKLRTIELEYGS